MNLIDSGIRFCKLVADTFAVNDFLKSGTHRDTLALALDLHCSRLQFLLVPETF